MNKSGRDGGAGRLATENGELSGDPGKLPATSDVVERARQAVDAWDRFAVWAPTRVPGVRVCLDLVRDLAAEVEELQARNSRQKRGLHQFSHALATSHAEVKMLRTDLARMTERAEGAEVAWQDAETELAAARAALDRVRAVIDNSQTVGWAGRSVMHGGKPFPVMVSVDTIRRALDGEVSGE